MTQNLKQNYKMRRRQQQKTQITLGMVMPFQNNTQDIIHEGNTDKLDFIKTKNFCSVKNSILRIRRQVTDWDKVFTKDISDKGLLFKIYTECLKLNKKKTTPLQNRPKTVTDTIKEDNTGGK